MVGDYNDEVNFPHKLLLTNTQVSKICKSFVKPSSVDINFSKSQLSKTVKLGGFLDALVQAVISAGVNAIKKEVKKE